MIRAVIFDFNGVLVDDEAIHFELFREVLGGQKIELTEQSYYDEYLGYDDRGCLTLALERDGRPVTPTLVDDLIALKASLYTQRADQGLRYFPGGAETARLLASRWPLAVCSGALLAEIEYSLDRLAIRDLFATIISAEDTDRCKPDPEGYLLTLDALRSCGATGLEAGHCLVIEDSLAGVRSAKSAGMWAVAVPHSYPADELRKAGADAVASTLAEITPNWIRSLFLNEVSP